MGMYLFPIGAITKYHELGDLKQLRYYCLASLEARSF